MAHSTHDQNITDFNMQASLGLPVSITEGEEIEFVQIFRNLMGTQIENEECELKNVCSLFPAVR